MSHAHMRKEANLTEGPILGRMILFTLPVMATGVLQLLFNAADLAVVGRYCGDAAMGAVGCCGALINLIVNLFMGLSVGAGVIAAQDIGAHRYDDVKRLVNTSVTSSLIGGFVVGVLGFLAARPLLTVMGTPADVLEEAVPYMRAYFCGMPGCLLYNYLASILRSSGDTHHPLIFLSTAGIANVILNFTMVLGFHMGALGVGIATAVSQYISAGLIFLYMLRMDGCCQITGAKVDFSKLKRMVTIGLPAGLQGTMFSLSNVIIQASINGYGTAVVAGNTAGSNLDGFQYIAMNSVYHAALTFVGQNVGAGKYERIKKIAWDSVAIVTVIGVVMGAMLIFFGDTLLLIYAPGEENAAVVAAGMNRLVIMGASYFLCGLMDVGCGLLRGMGKAVLPMVVSLMGSCVFRIGWVTLVCPYWPDNIFVLYISYPISWLVTAVVHYCCFAYFYRKLMRRKSASLV